MFGIFRTLLALAVVFGHLGSVPHIGAYAVFGFYFLSGYLMTYIMHHTYGYSLKGISQFCLNRWLRIFPIYYFSATLSLILVLLLGEEFTRSFHENIGFPQSTDQILRNLFLILTIHTDTRLVPPAWALTVECFYYLCIGFGLSATPLRTLIWFMASVTYTIYLIIGGASPSYRYFPVAAASLPFSAGALLYHFRQLKVYHSVVLAGNNLLVILILTITFNYIFGVYLMQSPRGVCFYINLLLTGFVINNLCERKKVFSIDKNLDSIIGDLSYPIYLLHYQCGLVVSYLASGWQLSRGLFLLAAVPIVIASGFLMARFFERPIEKIRNKIKR